MTEAHVDELADGPVDEVDVQILGRLRSALEASDPVPADLVERSLFAMTLAALDAEVMSLQELASREGAMRSDGGSAVAARTVTFTASALSMMITLSSDDGAVRVDGWISPPRELEVELRRAGSEPRTVVADEGGRFAFPRVDKGLVGFVLHDVGSGSATLTTPIIEI
ncbi:hypothetical protein ATL41_1114 [Flavimobilis soli]|uniref:Carboxypeptidase regulatory-like domain-containing protein n=1 Tax=Flavimobilis soli TaxID=442709 RepID=A0A2A9EDP9_9MICO|nr:hypothetical protein [Flavimobilis soli]PFG36395.1 hypothetical protein ATL41_1114 [Flavimobilis soli]